MLNFDFLEKDLGVISPLHFVNDFSRKMFLMNNIVLMSLLITLNDVHIFVLASFC